jgi:hypothetical protein
LRKVEEQDIKKSLKFFYDFFESFHPTSHVFVDDAVYLANAIVALAHVIVVGVGFILSESE